ncbi:MAG: transcription-repair coupling factor [Actinomycetes bacterium]
MQLHELVAPRLGELPDTRRATIAVDPALAPFIAASRSESVIVVCATGREADELFNSLTFLRPDEVSIFPAWETLPHERLSPRADTVGRRLTTLRALRQQDREARIIVTTIRALLAPIISGLGDVAPLEFTVGRTMDMSEMVERLVEGGYSRVDLVEKRGEFAVRGGIVDLFSPLYEHPMRIEFWGDRIEEVRYFNVADQRSIDPTRDVHLAPPCRELALTESVRNRAAALLIDHPEFSEILEKLSLGIAVEGMEAFAPALVDNFDLLLDLVPSDSTVLLIEPERIRTRAADLFSTSKEFLEAAWLNAAAGNIRPIDFGATAYRELEMVSAHAGVLGLKWWELSPFSSELDGYSVPSEEMPFFRGDTEALIVRIRQSLSAKQSVLISSAGVGTVHRFEELLREHDVACRVSAEITFDADVVQLIHSPITRGFSVADIFFLTEAEISSQRSSTKDMRKLPSKRRDMIDPLDLKPGDYVVHEQHGVGQFVEMVQRAFAGGTREYLVIEYAASKRGQPGDRLFVPTESLDQISRYVGGEAPSVHRLGGADWQKAKGRARKAVKEIAGELIRLYAARTSSPGFAFSPDTPWQRELEDAFPYQETPDQLATINDVKADMERPIPMDRVVCGDVGYGKTEIAVRAAFKAVQDGKQVALLVPTTLLVAQHINTFRERYSGFPINLAGLSRFESPSEVKATIAGLAAGSIDIVIGTHRLLSSDVQFKDLGLVIVDEEQRFGVEHKESLKKLRTYVDVLTMSATPIPRTLEMSIAGIREMSTITTPPEERLPILTFVGPYDPKQLTAAIRRELLRDGQVFYVHNRVESIDRVAQHLKELVPEARIRVAHGQMHEDLLEDVIVGFWERDFDVLVSTSIIESGIDIANANTLIVERADLMGLSQLHQLRGRVGRARERAYAYFLYPAEKPLSENAHDRLRTIAAHTDLGSGMYVAMKDLEIRGAGNLLGGEQSGHIADVGFDLYMRMVGEAVSEYRGTTVDVQDCKIDLPVNAHIPHSYIDSQKLRLDIYRRLADASEVSAGELRSELRDRYGEIPEMVERLFAVAALRNRAKGLGLREIALAGKSVRLATLDLPDSAQLRVTRLFPGSTYRVAAQTLLVPISTGTPGLGNNLRDEEILEWAHRLLDALPLAASPAPSALPVTS